MVFICYPKCTTCAKAKRWLSENGISFDVRDIKEEHPLYEEIKEWHAKSGLPLRRFFNTSGMSYRSLNLKERLKEMSEEEQMQLLATDGMLIKRPILVSGKTVLVGFREEEWRKQLISDM
jgi:arsenate reductase